MANSALKTNFEEFMKCPIKRKLIINLINSEKDNIEDYKNTLAKQQPSESPLRNVKKKYICESPSALLRRRALQQQQKNSSAVQSTSSESTCSFVTSSVPSPIIFNKILDGVVAYIEIKTKDHDRSDGVKALVRAMGATVEDQFSKKVTHVIFKDGSYTTYQKAKLMGIHLVSVLWIEACRTSGVKVAEKRFPALGTDAYDHNISAFCSQIQKDYEEIIREEFSKSLRNGTPLPSTQTLINRRRTIMTPNISSNSISSQIFATSQDKQQVSDVIINEKRKSLNFDFASNAHAETEPSSSDDLVALIDGILIEKNDIHVGIQDIRNAAGFIQNTPPKSREEITPEIYQTPSRKTLREVSNEEDKTFVRRRTQSASAGDDLFRKDKRKLTLHRNEIEIFSKNSSRKDVLSPSCESAIEMSALQLQKSSTDMSTLHISSDTEKNASSSSFNTKDHSFSPVQEKVIERVLHILDDGEVIDNVTKRRKNKSTVEEEEVFKTPAKQVVTNEELATIPRRYTKNRQKVVAIEQKQSNDNSIEKDKENIKENSFLFPVQPKTDNPKTTRKLRKLYDPCNSPQALLHVADDEERKNMRAKKCRLQGGVIEPATTKSNIVQLSDKAKAFVNQHHVNVDKIFNNVDVDRQLISEKKESERNDELLGGKVDIGGEKPVKGENNDDSAITPKRSRRKNKFANVDGGSAERRFSARLSQHSNKLIPLTPLRKDRRSTMDFETKITSTTRRKTLKIIKEKSIVATKMHRDEIAVFSQIVGKLGGFRVEDQVSNKTTHLVAGEAKRTINMLKAIIAGCWIVQKEWLFKSLEAGKWLPEEDFEVTNFSPAVQKCRLQRQAFRKKYSMDIFRDCGLIFISRGTNPRCSDLKELVTLCEGKCTTIVGKAAIVVGELYELNGAVSVTENWILDSITFCERLPLKKYIISSKRTSTIV